MTCAIPDCEAISSPTFGRRARLGALRQRPDVGDPEVQRQVVLGRPAQAGDARQRHDERHRARDQQAARQQRRGRAALGAGGAAGGAHRAERAGEAAPVALALAGRQAGRCGRLDRGLLPRHRVKGLGLADRAAEQPRSEDPQQRRDESQRHGRDDQRAQRQAGPEDPEELQLAGQQRGRAGGDDHPGGQDGGSDLGRRRAGGRQPVLAAQHPPPRLGEVEDGVVGDQAEQQHHEQRLDLLRHARVEALAREGQQPHGDHVGQRRRAERDQGRQQRAEVEEGHQQDRRNRGDLDRRQGVLDDVELGDPGGGGAGDAHPALRPHGQAAQVVLAGLEPSGEVLARVDEQVVDRGGGPLGPRHARQRDVDQRHRAEDPLAPAVGLDRAARALDVRLQRLAAQSVRVAVHDDDVGGGRRAEQLGGPL
jgi:hypothetical protein